MADTFKGVTMTERKGRQEPTTAFVLPYEDTDGQIAVDLYNMSGRQVMPWQEALIYDILGKDASGKWVHSRFGYEVPRRNGKGEILILRELYGLAIGEKILHTAHLVSTAHSAWERTCAILDMLGIDYSKVKAKGQEYIDLYNGGHIDYRTRTATGALGEGFDLVVIDEAQEYRTEHQTALKYVVSAAENPQTILCGTPPTAVSAGTVFKDYRADVLAGKLSNAGWAEWSVEELADVNDRELWYRCNPSMGYNLTERKIADEIGQSDAERIDFNIQRLGLWISYTQQSVISRAAWDACEVKRIPKLTGKLAIGIKYHKTQPTVSMAVAAKASKGRIFIESIGRGQVRDGNAWIIDFLMNVKDQTLKVAVDGKNGEELLRKDMKAAGLKPPVVMKVSDIIEANQAMENAIYQKTLCHMGQPSLAQVVSNVEHRAIGSQGGFGWRPLNDEMGITLLESAAIARWVRENAKEGKQKISY